MYVKTKRLAVQGFVMKVIKQKQKILIIILQFSFV